MCRRRPQVWDARANASKPRPGLLFPTLLCLGETALFMGCYLKGVVDFNVNTFTTAWYWQATIFTRQACTPLDPRRTHAARGPLLAAGVALHRRCRRLPPT